MRCPTSIPATTSRRRSWRGSTTTEASRGSCCSARWRPRSRCSCSPSGRRARSPPGSSASAADGFAPRCSWDSSWWPASGSSGLPFAAVTLVRRRDFGLSEQGWGGWLTDQLTSLAVQAVLVSIAVAGAVWLAGRLGPPLVAGRGAGAGRDRGGLHRRAAAGRAAALQPLRAAARPEARGADRGARRGAGRRGRRRARRGREPTNDHRQRLHRRARPDAPRRPLRHAPRRALHRGRDPLRRRPRARARRAAPPLEGACLVHASGGPGRLPPRLGDEPPRRPGAEASCRSDSPSPSARSWSRSRSPTPSRAATRPRPTGSPCRRPATRRAASPSSAASCGPGSPTRTRPPG